MSPSDTTGRSAKPQDQKIGRFEQVDLVGGPLCGEKRRALSTCDQVTTSTPIGRVHQYTRDPKRRLVFRHSGVWTQ